MSKKCQNCGSAVTEQFARVFGDEQDRIHHCLDCPEDHIGRSELRVGAGAKSNIEDLKRVHIQKTTEADY